MSIYNSILKSFILPVGDYLTGNFYAKNIELWKSYDSLSEYELQNIQNSHLSTILKYANTHVPLYKNLKLDLKNTPSDLLNTFPILTKDILRDAIDDLISDEYQKSNLNMNHSSGSSGKQSFTYMTKAHQFYLRALQTHWWTWSGFTIGDRVLQFGISQKRNLLKSIKDLCYRTFYHKAFGITEEGFKDLASTMIAKNINYIAGYPSVINQLALASPITKTIQGVICFGDKLFNSHTNAIKAAFGNEVTIIDTYGCAEGLLMACKKDIEFYYIMSPHVYIEIVDDKGKHVPDGTMGHILVTCLTNKAMPLIRYKLGDLGIMLPKHKYPKHKQHNYPLLQKIIGRETDVIKTDNGTILNVHSFTGVFEYFQEIKQYKIIQRDLKSIIIEYISADEISESRFKELKSKFLNLTNSELKMTFVKVENITSSASGKPQIIDTTLI